MRRHIQTLKLNLTYTVIQCDAQGLGVLGRVLGHIAGHLLGAQPLLVAGLGGMAHVQLLPQRATRVTAWSSSAGQGTATVAATCRTARSRRSAVNPAGGGATPVGQPPSVAASRRMLAWK
jgi:hypothetical protein